MLAEERHQKIIEKLHSDGSVKVKELSALFKVTEDCIRKDLAQLEKSDLLKRTYGGAVPLRQNTHSFEVVKRKASNVEAKKKIAAKAIELINAGDTIFLDISTSNIELAKEILNSGKRVTVVTNMIEIIQVFTCQSNVKLVSVGGSLNEFCDGFIGSLCIQTITQYKFDIAFVGAVGIDVFENSVFTYDAEDGLTKKAILKSSRKTYLVSEVVKFNHDGNYKYASIDEFKGIITDEKVNDKVKRSLYQSNVNLI
ncbi:DeoR/GlpR transcriptional regulator [Bacillus sp. HMF5848]|uniref:DeoR/GlpR family DNA-binding transcription regulator n=1 Tax=Bacillus sp. HMF5848 TaxID=2495421 RepID=UPI000F77C7CD|nr:DeoR/GlpR family DNA-binding transcription regulator [Bacillus sp. HMF5848]RSK25880.1 DeoR/GlpR transcriptional regulator [Bacillus sp. HMF5848]